MLETSYLPLMAAPPPGSGLSYSDSDRIDREVLVSILKSIRNVNQLITKADTREEVIESAADLLTEEGGFHRAWIAITDPEGDLKGIKGSNMNERLNILENLFLSNTGPPCWEKMRNNGGKSDVRSFLKECSNCPINYGSPYGKGLARILKHNGKDYGMISVYLPSYVECEDEYISLFKEVAGDISFSMGKFDDRDRIKKASEALKESEEKYQTLFESSPDSLFIVGLDGGIIDVNETAVKTYGYSREEFGSLKVTDIARDELKEKAPERIAKAGQISSGFEWEHKKKDGTVFPVEIHSHPITLSGKDCILASARDLTGSRRIEDSLRMKSLMLDSIGEAVITTDLEGRIRYWNKAAERIYGWREEEVLGKNILEVTPSDEMILQASTIMDRLSEGNSWEGEFWVKRKSGERFPIQITDNPVLDKYGNLEGIIGISRDITEQKKAKEALSESERLYKSIFNNSRDMFFLHGIGPDLKLGSFMAVNDRACDVLGYSRKELLRKLPVDIVERNQRGSYRENIKNILEKGESIFERTFVSRTKEKVRVEINSHLIDLGGSMCILAIARDIRPRVEAQRELVRSERNYKTLVENSPDVIIRFDRDLKMVYCNKRIKELMDFTKHKCEGSTISQMENLPQDIRRYWTEKLEETLREERRIEFELELPLKEGKKDFHLVLVPEKENGTGWSSILCLARDITEMRRFQRSYKMLFDEMMDGFALHEIIIDEMGSPVDFRFLDVNPAFESLTGLRAEDLLGRTAKETLPGMNIELIDVFGKVALLGEDINFHQYSNVFGKYFNIKAFSPRKGQFVTVFEDITQQKELENSLEEQKNLSQFYLDLFSHDMGNIHQSMYSNAELALIKRDDPGFLYTAIENQMTLTMRSLRLVKYVKLLSRLTEEEHVFKPIDIRILIDDIVDDIKEMYTDRKPIIEVKLPKDEVLVNSELIIEELFFNLIQNSVKFQKVYEPKVKIEMIRDRTSCICTTIITDWGAGIPDNIKPLIFDRRSTSRRDAHTGIGLSIVKELVDRYGGSISVTDRVDGDYSKGTVFTVELPVTEPRDIVT